MQIDARKVIDSAWIVIGIVWLIGSVTSKRTVRTQSGGSRIVQACLTIAAFFLIFDSSLRVGSLGWRFVPKSPAVSWIGAALTVAGILFAIWAILIGPQLERKRHGEAGSPTHPNRSIRAGAPSDLQRLLARYPRHGRRVR
jgi:hypothetical protein